MKPIRNRKKIVEMGKTHLPFKALLIVIVCLFSLGLQNAKGQVANGTYKLVNRNSGQVLTASGGGIVNQTPLAVWPYYNGDQNSQWVLTNVGGDQYKLMGVASGRYINVYNSGTADGVPIRLYDWNNLNNFKFTLVATDSGYYKLVFINSGKALSVVDATTAQGRAVVQMGDDLTGQVREIEKMQWKFLAPTDGVTAAAPFEVVLLPDTQEYAGGTGTAQMFYDQTNWIKAQRTARNIVYVAGLGDIVNHGNVLGEWEVARQALYVLDDTVPYGTTLGNHDFNPDYAGQTLWGTGFYNQFFGVSHFVDKNYYGGHYGSNNDNHYDLFTAGGMDFIIVYMRYYDISNPEVSMPWNEINWVNRVLKAHPNRRAIVVSHEIIDNAGNFKTIATQLYGQIKTNPNLFLMLCGHYTGESSRVDIYNNSKVTTIMTDYQDQTGGGNGKLRLLRFRPSENLIECMIYSPTLNYWYTAETPNNIPRFTVPYTMQGASAPLDAVSPYYILVNKSTGKAIDLIGGNTANGAVLNQWSYNNNAWNQRFLLAPSENIDHFKIINWVAGKSLSVSGNSSADYAQIISSDYIKNNAAQQWDLVDVGNGWFKIRNVASGKVLDVANANVSDGAKIQQLTENGNDAQLWRLQPQGDYYVKATSGKYIGIQGGSNATNSPIVQNSGTANPWFQWRFEGVGGADLKVSSLNALTRALSVSGNSTASSAACVLSDYNVTNTGSQKVRLKPLLNGRVEIGFVHTSMNLDVRGNSLSEDTVIQQYPDNSGVAQEFQLQRLP